MELMSIKTLKPKEIEFEAQNLGQPLITIGIPVYNGEKTLVEALDSILRQTIDDFEVIISDNASTDGTAEICRRHAMNDPRIRYIRHEFNMGAYSNFKFTLDQARGKYFLWTAADDYRSHDCLMHYLANIGVAGGVFSTYAQFDRSTGEIVIPSTPQLSSNQTTYAAVTAFFARHRTPMFYGMFRTSAASSCFGDTFFDWYDSYFLLKIIKKYGMNTTDGPPRFFYACDGTYKTKPISARFIRTWPYFKKTVFMVLPCGPIAFLFYANVFRESFQINAKLILSLFKRKFKKQL